MLMWRVWAFATVRSSLQTARSWRSGNARMRAGHIRRKALTTASRAGSGKLSKGNTAECSFMAAAPVACLLACVLALTFEVLCSDL